MSAALVSSVSAPASAATMTGATFDFRGPRLFASSIDFDASGIGLTAIASSERGRTAYVTQNSRGLGVFSNILDILPRGSQVDGLFGRDVLTLSFDKEVYL